MWRAQRKRATAQGRRALLEVLEREDDAARTARRRALAEVTNNRHNGDRTDLESEYGGAGTRRCGDGPSDEDSFPETSVRCLDGKARQGVASSDKGRVGKRHEERADTGKVAGERECRAGLLQEDNVHRPRERNELDDREEPEQDGKIGADLNVRARNGPCESPPIFRTTSDETAGVSTTGVPTSIPVTTHQSNKQVLEPPPASQPLYSGDRPHTHSVNAIIAEPETPEPLSPPEASSLVRQARGRSFSSSEGSAPLTDNNTLPDSRAVHRENSDHARGGNDRLSEVGLTDDGWVATAEAETAVAAVKRVPSGSEDQHQHAHHRSRPHVETRREGEKNIDAGVGPRGEIEAAKVGADSTTHGNPSESERSAEAARPTSPEDARPCLSLPASSRALVALTLQIEALASRASEAAVGRGEQAPPSPALIVVNGYGSADAAASGDRNAATARATTTAAGGDHDRFGEFSLSTLCGAVLDLVTARAGGIIPAEMLSGLVSAAKVRAQHRRKGPPGTVQLFDAFVGHARRVVAWGGVGSDTVAGVFAPCFEPVVARMSGGRGGGAERLRRKIFALLQSAADADTPASTNASSTTAFTASARLTRSGIHGGDGSSKIGVKPLPRGADATVPDARDDRARVDEVGTTQPRPPMRSDNRRASSRQQEEQQQQQQRATDDEQRTENSNLSLARLDTGNDSDTARDHETGPTKTVGGVSSQGRTGESAGHGGSMGGRVTGKPSLVLAESNPTSSKTRSVSELASQGTTAGSGVVLGGSGRTGRKKKGNLNLSAMGMMGIFSAGGEALPEFEVSAGSGKEGRKDNC